MPEVRDPAIKLFGRNIPVPDCRPPGSDTQIPAAAQVTVDTPIQKSGKDFPSSSDEARENNHRISSQEDEVEGNHDPAEDQDTPNELGDIETVLKKPEKILPCPRCHSWDTKFCYFNNRNVNQPRHFCKNCHRYWTAGGTMRNVPVGAGRRRNKHSTYQCRQLVVTSDGLPPATSRPAEGMREVLKFGREAPLCESMAASLNLGDPTISVKMGATETPASQGEEPSSSGYSFTSTTVNESELPEAQAEKAGFHGHYDRITSEHPVNCYPGPQWAYPWNALMFGSNNSNPNVVNTGSPPMMAISNLCPPSNSISIPFMPGSYWGWEGRNWNIPLIASATTGCLSPSSSCSGNNSPTLGKHSRDASLQTEEKTEQSLWVPKTLRIDDLDEAAKSSIWDTLGIKTGSIQPIKKGGIFKAFQSKPEPVSLTSDADADASQVLQANPAAFSRSLTFQENT